MDIKKKRTKEKYSENESEYVVCIFFFWCFFYDKIIKNKKEFNIFICSRLRIINLCEVVVLISDEKIKYLKYFYIKKNHEAIYLSQIGCVRNANIFSSHN